MAEGNGRRWATRGDVVLQLRQRWDRGEFLRRYAQEQPWEPLAVSLRRPTVRELAADLGAVQDWARGWALRNGDPIRVELEPIGGRLIGVSQVPTRIWIDGYPQLWRLLGVSAEVTRFEQLLGSARSRLPRVGEWMTEHPIKVLSHQQVWPQLLAVVEWIRERSGPGVYLRQIDVPLVDTKFIETHRSILCDLLDHELPPERVDRDQPREQFAARYRFATKPVQVRLRRLDGGGLLAGLATGLPGDGPAELTLRVDDLAGLPIQGRTVFVVENEITYLAFPPIPDAVVLFGGGYGLTRLGPLSWLAERELIYWGDLDTHGFAILNQLRAAFPQARSMLMDRQTFLAHENHWGQEPKPVNARLDLLTGPEADLYRDLIEDRYGPRLRLEQERVSFAVVLEAVDEIRRIGDEVLPAIVDW